MREAEDQIAAARHLGTLPFIDPARIGINGWSYGGYLSLMCLLLGGDAFKLAIAGAPVTHWSLYDTIYTERYMGLPEENPEGYEASAPLTHARKLQGKLLLVHGTADDNVHFQNSARLAAELQERGLSFETMYYPGQGHGLARPVQNHWQRLFEEFVLNNL